MWTTFWILFSLVVIVLLYLSIRVVIPRLRIYVKVKGIKSSNIVYLHPKFFVSDFLKGTKPECIVLSGDTLYVVKLFSLGFHTKYVFCHATQFLKAQFLPHRKEQPKIGDPKTIAYSRDIVLERVRQAMKQNDETKDLNVQSVYLFAPFGQGIGKHEGKQIKDLAKGSSAFGNIMVDRASFVELISQDQTPTSIALDELSNLIKEAIKSDKS